MCSHSALVKIQKKCEELMIFASCVAWRVNAMCGQVSSVKKVWAVAVEYLRVLVRWCG